MVMQTFFENNDDELSAVITFKWLEKEKEIYDRNLGV